jgi:hypothetical protein
MLVLNMASVAAEQLSTWQQLEPSQQIALKPLQSQWNTLPSKLQNHLLVASNGYAKLTPVQQQRFQVRLEKWSKLTPEQRKLARKKYLAYKMSQQNTVIKQADVQK